MTKTIAVFALLVLGILNHLGNFWYVYGIWPKSWGLFFFFAISSIILSVCIAAISSEKS